MAPRYLDALVPAGDAADAILRRALARDATRRVSRALAAWQGLGVRMVPRARLDGIDPASGRFRCWLAEVEDALAIARETRRERLIERVADAGFLARVAPQGRIPRDFARRAREEAKRLLRASARGLDLHPGAFGRLLVERGARTVTLGRDPRFERRVGRAMALLDTAWPEAASMVRARTWRIVPVSAAATVSFSSAREPGVAYIDVRSAPDLRMAEDLVHETTHMRLHEIESVRPLVRRQALDEPRFYSPWRREWRPVRGLVHAVCTFTVGAIWFERMLASQVGVRPARRRWLARRLLEERASVAIALAAFRGTRARGLLTEAGRRVVRAAAREHAALSDAARRRERWLASSVEGRAELARLSREISRLRARPLRWRWEA